MSAYEKANKLALENNISRKVLSVRLDDKRSEWCVTHETSRGLKDSDGYRCDVDYFMFDNDPGFKLNEALLFIKAKTTLTFLGLSELEIKQVKPVKQEKEKAITAEPGPDPTPEEGKTVYEEGDESDFDTIPKKKRKRKRTKIVAVKTPEASAAEPVVDADAMDLPPDGTETTYEVYRKDKTDHAVHLRDLVVNRFGNEWKKDKDAVLAVKKIVAQLHNNVAVTNGKGEVLKSFVEFVGEQLKAA